MNVKCPVCGAWVIVRVHPDNQNFDGVVACKCGVRFPVKIEIGRPVVGPREVK